jgi:hypothetical protein
VSAFPGRQISRQRRSICGQVPLASVTVWLHPFSTASSTEIVDEMENVAHRARSGLSRYQQYMRGHHEQDCLQPSPAPAQTAQEGRPGDHTAPDRDGPHPAGDMATESDRSARSPRRRGSGHACHIAARHQILHTDSRDGTGSPLPGPCRWSDVRPDQARVALLGATKPEFPAFARPLLA